jgi:hypothetical protein
MSGGEQNLWLIPGEEERIYGVKKIPRPGVKVPLYAPLTDEEKVACAAKQAQTVTTTKTIPPPVVVPSPTTSSTSSNVSAADSNNGDIAIPLATSP